MRDESILEVGTDAGGRLFVRPAETPFDQIFRTATGVHWDGERRALFVREPGEWTPGRWFEQILTAVADEYGVALRLTPSTVWTRVPPELQQNMQEFSDGDFLAQLLERRKDANERYWQDFQMKQALTEADKLWSEGKYPDYVRVLTPFRDRLSHAQLKRLTFAKKRFGN